MNDRIELDPRVCNGKPVIRATRIPVKVILELLVEGLTWDGIKKEYPELSSEDIRATLEYARDAINLSSPLEQVS